MTEFTAPQSGRYHFATGQEPHLESDCTGTCEVGITEPDTVVTIEFDNSENRFTPANGKPFYPEG